MSSPTKKMIELAKNGASQEEIADKLKLKKEQVRQFLNTHASKEIGVYARIEVDRIVQKINEKVVELVDGINCKEEEKLKAIDKSRIALNLAKVSEILSKGGNGGMGDNRMYDEFEMRIKKAVKETEKFVESEPKI